MSSRLDLVDIHKSYSGGSPVLTGVSLGLDEGEILALLGPSGSGKSTLLRVVAGLEKPDRGLVRFDGRDLAPVPPHRRRFGLMFQEFALFPHRRVAENVAFGLEMLKLPPDAVARRIAAMLDLVGLGDLARRRVGELSGGERQRVALARSLAPEPLVLMLDEPLGALDRAWRERLLPEIRRILKTLAQTAVFVTHDQAEALAVADRVAVLIDGRLEQVDPPEVLYRRPRSEAVARFLGFENLLPGRLETAERVRTPVGVWPVEAGAAPAGAAVTALIRPESAEPVPIRGATADSEIDGRVLDVLFAGRFHRLTVMTRSGRRLVFELVMASAPAVGTEIRLRVHPTGVVLLPPPQGGWTEPGYM